MLRVVEVFLVLWQEQSLVASMCWCRHVLETAEALLVVSDNEDTLRIITVLSAWVDITCLDFLNLT